jgi:hypothetical protein
MVQIGLRLEIDHGLPFPLEIVVSQGTYLICGQVERVFRFSSRYHAHAEIAVEHKYIQVIAGGPEMHN